MTSASASPVRASRLGNDGSTEISHASPITAAASPTPNRALKHRAIQRPPHGVRVGGVTLSGRSRSGGGRGRVRIGWSLANAPAGAQVCGPARTAEAGTIVVDGVSCYPVAWHSVSLASA